MIINSSFLGSYDAPPVNVYYLSLRRESIIRFKEGVFKIQNFSFGILYSIDFVKNFSFNPCVGVTLRHIRGDMKINEKILNKKPFKEEVVDESFIFYKEEFKKDNLTPYFSLDLNFSYFYISARYFLKEVDYNHFRFSPWLFQGGMIFNFNSL
jgi:hypothetical protein